MSETAHTLPFDFSEFEKFEGFGARRKDPAIGIQSRGSISFNAEAFSKLGRPTHVELFFNPKRDQIMIKAADAEMPGVARTRINGKGMGAIVAAKAFFTNYGISYSETKGLKIVALEKGLAVAQILEVDGEQQ